MLLLRELPHQQRNTVKVPGLGNLEDGGFRTEPKVVRIKW